MLNTPLDSRQRARTGGFNMSNTTITQTRATAGGSATAVLPTLDPDPKPRATEGRSESSVRSAQPFERHLPDPESSPREFNVLLLGLIDHRCDLASLLSIHNIRIRDLAAWLRLPATQQALHDIEFITTIRNKHIALDQAHSALSALAAMIHSEASPETRRKAASAVLRTIPHATENCSESSVLPGPSATAGGSSRPTAAPSAASRGRSGSRPAPPNPTRRTLHPPPTSAFRPPPFRLSPRLTPTSVPSRISLRARAPRQPVQPDTG